MVAEAKLPRRVVRCRASSVPTACGPKAQEVEPVFIRRGAGELCRPKLVFCARSYLLNTFNEGHMITAPAPVRGRPQRACALHALPVLLLLPLLLLLHEWRRTRASLGFSDDALSQAADEQGWSLPDNARQELSPRPRSPPPPQHQDSSRFESQDAHSVHGPQD